MSEKLTQKQEGFTLNLFKGMTQRESWIQAGYSSNYAMSIVDVRACELANKGKIKVRLAELNGKTESKAVMSVVKRKERLSVFANEDNEGQYGLVRQPNISAIAELNKMEHIYEVGGNIRDVNVVFVIGKGYEEKEEGEDV